MPARPSSSGFVRVCLLVLALCAALGLAGCGKRVLSPTGRARTEVTSANAARVVVTARKQIGTHYRYGGNSPKGFDCSGLIWWSYRQHGINVPRVAKDQARTGKAVAPAKMRPGDILVFQTQSGLHTALYTGKGKFVHAPSSGKRVREDAVNNTYWKPRLKGVRRVTG